MTRYIARRLLGMIPTFLVLLFLAVAMLRFIPGDIVDLMLEGQSGAHNVNRTLLEHRLGLDQSLPGQYVHYTAGVLHGDLGRSLWNQQDVAGLIAQRLPPTLEMVGLAVLISLILAVPIGTISAVRQDSVLDYALRSAAILGLSVPNFALATMVLIFPALWFHWTPPLNYKSLTADPLANLGQLIIPALILGVGLSASIVRLLRATMLEVLREDFIRTAWSKGLRERTIVLRHCARNALIPVVTLFGIQLAFLISGSVIMEQIFAVPGVGRLLLDAISQRDYPVVQGVTVIVALWVLVINLVVDVSYVYLDPRLRLA
ncbi:MAG TPA: ABC transporter permease [Dehalococcoidia bacterium]|nr:ABC transporter permease [Dehalococcoidia bacterium]